MRIAVTGATGHLGANLVRLLVDRGHAVRALCHSHRKLAALEHVDAEPRVCEVLDPQSLTEAFAGVDVVMHLAGVISIKGDPDGRVTRTNVEGVRNVVDACLADGVGKLIHFSSIHAFKVAASDRIVDESQPPADTTCFRYDQSKALGEREILSGVARGLDATILNPTGVIGPFDFAPSRAGRMLKTLFAGGMPVLLDGGFDWVDARDVAEAALTAIDRGGTGQRYLLSGQWASFAELASLCDTIAGHSVKRWTVSPDVARLGLPFAALFGRLSGREPLFTAESLEIAGHGSRTYSHARAARDLGYAPRPLKETLADTHAWFRARGDV